MKKKHIWAILTILPSLLNAQSENPLGNLFNVSPISPSQTAFAKFDNVQVSNATGIPGINIPIYSYSSTNKKINVNVSLDYHAGGVKVGEKATSLGLGWKLNGYGVIQRTSRGRPDESGLGYMSTSPIADYNRHVTCSSCMDNILYKYNTGYIDGEPDLFSFSFGARSGNFVIGKDRKILLIPEQNIDIILDPSQTGLLNSFLIIDESGTSYLFDKEETVFKSNGTTEVTAWYLSKIKSAFGTDSIEYKYKMGNADISSVKDRTIFYDHIHQQRSDILSDIYTVNIYEFTSISAPRLSEISFPNDTKVLVEYDNTQRCDLPGDTAIKAIIVKSPTNQIRYSLTQEYYPKSYMASISNCLTLPSEARARIRMVLSGVMRSGNGVSENPYRFEYYQMEQLPTTLSFEQDHWGYFNGALANKSLLPNMGGIAFGNGYHIVNADRRTNAEKVKYGSLKKITYPTGGICEFEFEANDTKSGITLQEGSGDPKRFVGGLRVKRIAQFDGVSHSNDIIRSYEYTYPDGTSSGYLNIKPDYGEDIEYSEDGAGSCFAGQSSGSYSASFFAINSSSVYSLSYALGSPIHYSRVVEINGEVTSNNGKIVREFTTMSDLSSISFPRFIPNFPYKPAQLPDWSFGLLKSQTVYNKDGKLLDSLVNVYQHYVTVLPDSIKSNYKGVKVAIERYSKSLVSGSCGPVDMILSVYAHVPFTGRVELKRTDYYKHWQDATGVKTTSTYEYENALHKRPTRIISTTSTGDYLVEESRFPQDFVGITTVADPVGNGIKKLLATHVFDETIEKVTYKKKPDNSTALTSGVFFQFKSDVPVLEKIYNINIGPAPISDFAIAKLVAGVVTRDNRYQERFLFQKYDQYGNIIQQQKKDNFLQSFIWDNRFTNPVAEVSNASSTDVAYTSFESSDYGNWDAYSGMIMSLVMVPTGTKCFMLVNGSSTARLSKAVTNGRKYVISYWRNSATPFNITGGTATVKSGPTVGDWTFHEHVVTANSASVAITGSGSIDEVRLYPLGAIMTTYTYIPLLGMSCQSDANGRISYFEYDELGRLSVVRDQNRNILKRYCYNYAGQLEDCGGFKNQTQSGNFTRNNCSSGYIGSTVTYTIAAGRFTSMVSQADANSQATTALGSEGQAYANTNGTCTAVTIYARAEYSGVYDDGDNTYGTVLLKFYSDAACTTPYSVSSLTVNYKRVRTNCGGGGTVTGNLNAVCNGTSTSIGLQTLLEDDGIHCWNYAFSVTAGTGYTAQ